MRRRRRGSRRTSTRTPSAAGRRRRRSARPGRGGGRGSGDLCDSSSPRANARSSVRGGEREADVAARADRPRHVLGVVVGEVGDLDPGTLALRHLRDRVRGPAAPPRRRHRPWSWPADPRPRGEGPRPRGALARAPQGSRRRPCSGPFRRPGRAAPSPAGAPAGGDRRARSPSLAREPVPGLARGARAAASGAAPAGSGRVLTWTNSVLSRLRAARRSNSASSTSARSPSTRQRPGRAGASSTVSSSRAAPRPAGLLPRPLPAQAELLERLVDAEQERPQVAVQLDPLPADAPPEPISAATRVREPDLDPVLARTAEGCLGSAAASAAAGSDRSAARCQPREGSIAIDIPIDPSPAMRSSSR